MKQDYWKSVPQEGAIERDWTNATLVLDLKNAKGENFHFEIEPVAEGQKDNLPPSYGNTGWGGKCQLDIHLPVL